MRAEVKTVERGGGLKIISTCDAKHSYSWESCDFYNKVNYMSVNKEQANVYICSRRYSSLISFICISLRVNNADVVS
jgi:hypothetical protein